MTYFALSHQVVNNNEKADPFTTMTTFCGAKTYFESVMQAEASWKAFSLLRANHPQPFFRNG